MVFNNTHVATTISNPNVIPCLINESDNTMLTKLHTDVEIWNILNTMNGDSVAGPYGFTTKFFIKIWDFIKGVVMDVVRDFLHGNPYTKFFSSINIVLIPKIISFNQMEFVKGRSIFDNILLAQEMVHDINAKITSGNLIYKLDITKAYDNLNWHFLYEILDLFGFKQPFIKLIKNSIENCYFSVIINGGNHYFFKSEHGLRQGDPLSPVLFIIAMEYLSRGLDNLFARHLMLYYRNTADFSITRLSFVDDFIIFSNASIKNVKVLFQFLANFQSMSGLSINNDKSNFIVSKSVNHVRSNGIKRFCGFNSTSLPIKYLGTPLYRGRKKNQLFDNIFTLIQKRIHNWSSNFLSFGGRLVLIKSVLNSIPIYI
ncbi:hypothetical protein MA16_Dca006356 [Dendrobium catenatum]|uniref:Reverse transcriptase domain-containing protein n=1 Tax=Dendrobium catenatum TaxID=906689 RepID=A0A2I0W9L7_9ASPA|nr:hypothetical protein MA16_Dca006356 [Dendrobium catenatum]